MGARRPICAADLVKELASKPETDHVVAVKSFQDMVTPEVINSVIANTCPLVG